MKTRVAVLLIALAIPVGAVAAAGFYDYGQHVHWLDMQDDSDEEMTSISRCEILGTTYWAVTAKNAGLSFYSTGTDDLELVGHLPLAGVEQDALIEGLYGYVISTPDRLAKVLTANPAAPALMWDEILPASPHDLERADDYLLIACGNGGLLVFDPTETYGLVAGVVAAWSGYAEEVKMASESVAVVRSWDTLITLDLSDPLHPTALDTITVPSGGRLLARNGLAYVSGHEQVLEIDLSDPSDLTLLRTLPGIQIYYGNSMEFVDEGILIGGSAVLAYLDLDVGGITWQAPPLGVTSYPEGIVQTGSYVGVAAGINGLHKVAWRAPEYAPSSLPFGEDRQMYGITIEDDLLFAHDRLQVHCYRLDLSAPALTWIYNPGVGHETITDMSATSSHLYLGFSSGRVQIVRYDTLTRSFVSGFFAGGGPVYSVRPLSGAAAGHLAVYAGIDAEIYLDRVLRIYAVQTATNPELVVSLQQDGFTNMATTGSTVVLWDISSGNRGVQLHDLDDPARIVPARHIEKAPDARVTVNRGVLYVLDAPGLRAYDISDPHAVVAGQSVPVPAGARDLVAHGDDGYLLGTMLVMNLGDPMAPRPVGSAQPRWFDAASFCAAGDGHVVFLDYKTLLAMPEHGTGPSPVAGPLPGAAGMSFAAYPNPFNPKLRIAFEMHSAGEATARIFDVRGRRVAEIAQHFFAAGPARLEWDGTTETGREAPSGVYFVRIATPAGEATRKVLLAR